MASSYSMIVAAFMVCTVQGLYTDQGRLHNGLTSFMETHSHIRKITVTSPVKITRRRSCKWGMEGFALSEYGTLLE